MKTLREELIDFVYWLNANIQNTIQDHLDKEEVDQYLESINSNESESNISTSLSPDIAENILKVRDAIIEKDYDEAWHWLYTIASPNYDKTADEVWTDLERIAGRL